MRQWRATDPTRITVSGTCISRKQASDGTTSVGVIVARGVVTYGLIGVEVDEEMRKRKEEGAKAEEEDAAHDPARLVSISAEVADRNEAKHRSDVVSTGDEARLRARQVEPLLNRRDDNAHESIDYHSLAM